MLVVGCLMSFIRFREFTSFPNTLFYPLTTNAYGLQQKLFLHLLKCSHVFFPSFILLKW